LLISTVQIARGIKNEATADMVDLPLSGSAESDMKDRTMRRDLIVNPGQYDPQGDRKSALIRDHHVLSYLVDDVSDQRVAIDRLRLGLDVPVPVKQRCSLSLGLALFNLSVYG